MPPEALAQVLRPIQHLFNPDDHPNLLVGLGVPDDAAVYRLNDEQALIVTTDFFTPIVDDAYHYGAIAAANALSDVYAMGGQPILALNIAAIPGNLPLGMTTQILLGMAEKVREANAVVAGGHTIKDNEPKVGLAAVGLVHPDQLLPKAGARPGDVLILTKPLGTGCITTAAKNDKAKPTHLEDAIRWMSRLNNTASEAARLAGAHAATDITGFGFLGHATEIAASSGVTLDIGLQHIPFLNGADYYAEEWTFPGGSADNRLAYGPQIAFAESITEEQQMLLFDAQTSGGLLIALPADRLEPFKTTMGDTPWWQVGHVTTRGAHQIVVRSK